MYSFMNKMGQTEQKFLILFLRLYFVIVRIFKAFSWSRIGWSSCVYIKYVYNIHSYRDHWAL